MEAWQVFDAPTEQLEAELRSIRIALPSSSGPEHARWVGSGCSGALHAGACGMSAALCRLQLTCTLHSYAPHRLVHLRDTIQQELDERGSSQNLLQQLLPIIQVQCKL